LGSKLEASSLTVDQTADRPADTNMPPPREADPAQMAADDFKKQLFTQLHSSGVVNSLKSQLRTQMLAQLQSRYAAGVQVPMEQPPSLTRRVINSMIADYLGSCNYHYTLSVFQPESGLSGSSSAPFTAEEIMQVMHLSKATPLSQALSRRGFSRIPSLEATPLNPGQAGDGPHCFMLQLVESIKEVNDRTTMDSGTQTYEGGAFRLGTALQLLEDQYAAQSKENASRPYRTMEERMSAYRREVDDRSKREVAQQVERVRELELSQVRLEEAAKYRKSLEEERQQMEKVYSDRAAKLREREEAINERLRRQQRDVEGAAFEHRQRIVKEEDRLRAWKAEVQADVERKLDEAQGRMAQVQAREAAVAAREIQAESRHSEAAEIIAMAEERAKRKAGEEIHSRREELERKRLAVESARAALMEQRAEAVAELSDARATGEKLRAAVAAKQEAELRTSALEASHETLRLKTERLTDEVKELRSQAKRGGGVGANLDASFASVGSFGYLVNAAPLPGTPRLEDMMSLKDALRRSEASRKKAKRQAAEAMEELQLLLDRDFDAARTAGRTQALLDEGVEGQEYALQVMEDIELAFMALCRESEELQASNTRMRHDLIQNLASGSGGSGSASTIPKPAAPTASLVAMQTATELKHEVEKLRRALGEHRRKVELQREETANQLHHIDRSANYSRRGGHFYDESSEKENDIEYDTSPLQRSSEVHRLVPGPAAPPGYVEAVVNGQRVLVPSDSPGPSPVGHRPPGLSPLQTFLAKNSGDLLQGVSPPASAGGQGASGLRIQTARPLEAAPLTDQAQLAASGQQQADEYIRKLEEEEKAGEIRRQELQRQADIEAAAVRSRLEVERAEAEAEQQRLAMEERCREEEAAAAAREEARRRREAEDIAAREEAERQQAEAQRRQEEAARLEKEAAKEEKRRRELAEADAEGAERLREQQEAEAERQRREAAEEAENQRRAEAQSMWAEDAERLRKEEEGEAERRRKEEEEAERCRRQVQEEEEEERAAAAVARQREEEAERQREEAERQREDAEEDTERQRKEAEEEAERKRQEAEQDKQKEEEDGEEARLREERLAEYRRKKEEQRQKEEEELLAALQEADDFSAPSASDDDSLSGGPLHTGDLDLEDLDDQDSLPPDLDDQLLGGSFGADELRSIPSEGSVF